MGRFLIQQGDEIGFGRLFGSMILMGGLIESGVGSEFLCVNPRVKHLCFVRGQNFIDLRCFGRLIENHTDVFPLTIIILEAVDHSVSLVVIARRHGGLSSAANFRS